MPTVLRRGPYRVFFFSHEPDEPPHVQVDAGGATAKFWIAGVTLARNGGFAPHEVRRIRRMLLEHEARLLEAWNAYFEA